MYLIRNVDINLPDDSGRMTITLNEVFSWKNKMGKKWTFAAGWSTDGHSIPGPFKNFDRLTIAAMCHDQDCEKATTYAQRRQGDKDYYQNMRDLGAGRTIRAAYLERVNQFVRTIELECGRMEIDYVPMNTNVPYDVSLANYLASRRQRGK